MTLGTIPRLTRTEAEQVAEHIWQRWFEDEKPVSFETEETRADFIQAIFLKACTIIEERPEAGEGNAP